MEINSVGFENRIYQFVFPLLHHEEWENVLPIRPPVAIPRGCPPWQLAKILLFRCPIRPCIRGTTLNVSNSVNKTSKKHLRYVLFRKKERNNKLPFGEKILHGTLKMRAGPIRTVIHIIYVSRTLLIVLPISHRTMEKMQTAAQNCK